MSAGTRGIPRFPGPKRAPEPSNWDGTLSAGKPARPGAELFTAVQFPEHGPRRRRFTRRSGLRAVVERCRDGCRPGKSQHQGQREQRSFDLQSQRGGRGEWTEESLAAFANLLQLGVTTLELDMVALAQAVAAEFQASGIADRLSVQLFDWSSLNLAHAGARLLP